MGKNTGILQKHAKNKGFAGFYWQIDP